MFQADQTVARIQRYSDDVEAQLLSSWMVLALHQPAGRHAPHLRPLWRSHALQGINGHGARDRPSALDLTEDQGPAIEADDVELAPARPVVALDDVEAASEQVLGGHLFAG